MHNTLQVHLLFIFPLYTGSLVIWFVQQKFCQHIRYHKFRIDNIFIISYFSLLFIYFSKRRLRRGIMSSRGLHLALRRQVGHPCYMRYLSCTGVQLVVGPFQITCLSFINHKYSNKKILFQLNQNCPLRAHEFLPYDLLWTVMRYGLTVKK